MLGQNKIIENMWCKEKFALSTSYVHTYALIKAVDIFIVKI